MQSWIFVVLGLLIIVLAVVLYAAIKRGQNEKQISQLSDDFEKMTNQPIYKTIEQLEAMNLAGESQKSFEKWRGVYYKLINDKFGVLYQNITNTEQANQSFKLMTANKLIETTTQQLEEARSENNDVADSLDRLVKSSEQNKVEIEKLSTKYREMRKEVLTKSFDYGNSVDAFEDCLSDVDKQFEQVRKLTSQGDHLEAKQGLANISQKLSQLKDVIVRIPPRYHELSVEFPDQLKEIKDVYEKMRADHFNFAKPGILETVALLHNKISVTLGALAKLDLPLVEQNNKAIVTQIDELYDRLQQEIDAKKEVEQLQKSTSEFLNNASISITNLIMSLDHLSQNYVLTHHELEDARRMQSETADMHKEYDIAIQEIADHQAVYTETVKEFNEIIASLNDMQAKQYQISNSVSGLFEGEKVAKQNVTQFELSLKSIQRDVEQLHLPGLPKTYTEYYAMVGDEVVKLKNNLNQVQINVEDITKQMLMTQEDLNTLTQKSEDLRDSAVLTEQALQYANRYTYGNETLAGAANEAKRIYNQEFDYAMALDTIASALDQVEPGSFKRIEESYYNTNAENAVQDQEDAE
ncbi:septation ring formation regulator EzrA [Lapidilactobacillus bayanensis]|uniref:septation ring formation regulator EzrA n=1 Tax=Lapidilactobacillus bayanensis TaxID=2485998 RepID=UPI0013DDDFD9|nr:septation ring formation regulator EzrA [Lapidilactobacillus bayanensis]